MTWTTPNILHANVCRYVCWCGDMSMCWYVAGRKETGSKILPKNLLNISNKKQRALNFWAMFPQATDPPILQVNLQFLWNLLSNGCLAIVLTCRFSVVVVVVIGRCQKCYQNASAQTYNTKLTTFGGFSFQELTSANFCCGRAAAINSRHLLATASAAVATNNGNRRRSHPHNREPTRRDARGQR